MPAKYQTPMSQKRKPLQTLLPLEQPLSLQIDACDACNFRCDFCYHSYTDYIGKPMEKQLFDKIVNDMQEFANPFKMVHLSGLGEPLLNPNIFYFVRRLKDELVAEKISITTNASLLTRETAQRLIKAGLDEIQISIYGLCNDEYLKFSNAKISFDELYENIKYFYEIREGCHMHIKIAGNYFDEKEKERFKKDFGLVSDTIHIDNAINMWPGLEVIENENHLYGIMDTRDTYQRICPMPFYALMIHSNGEVSPCCVDYGHKLIVGNINKESFKGIWNGEILQNLRRNILKNDMQKNSLCSCCTYPQYGASVDITPYREKLIKLY